jgi:3,4-dihydroxy 2-butanone 4-phosphate synthase/GTP cyclohydrolase II
MGAQILAELGLKKIRLLSNTTRKIVALEGYGLKIVENVALEDRGKKAKDLAGLGRVREFS